MVSVGTEMYVVRSLNSNLLPEAVPELPRDMESWEGNRGAVELFWSMSGICLLQLLVLEPLTAFPQVVGVGDLPSPPFLSSAAPQVTPFASSFPLPPGSQGVCSAVVSLPCSQGEAGAPSRPWVATRAHRNPKGLLLCFLLPPPFLKDQARLRESVAHSVL